MDVMTNKFHNAMAYNPSTDSDDDDENDGNVDKPESSSDDLRLFDELTGRHGLLASGGSAPIKYR